MPIKSYNIGGRTVIQLEDLRAYGFDVEWNSGERYLSVAVKDRPDSAPQAETEKQVAGNIAGTIYTTDIRGGINGVDCSFIDAYNIGGITCMAVEDLGAMGVLSDGYIVQLQPIFVLQGSNTNNNISILYFKG